MAAGGDSALKICSLKEVFTPGISKLSVSENLPIPSLHAQNTCLNSLVFRPLVLLASLTWLGWFIQKLSWPSHSHSWDSFLGKRRGGRELEGSSRLLSQSPPPSKQWLTFTCLLSSWDHTPPTRPVPFLHCLPHVSRPPAH